MKQETIDRIRKFTEDRDWEQFHSPANLAKSIVIEAAELLECFQWSEDEYDIQHIKEELADVMVYSQNLLDKLNLDADEIVNMKMSQTEEKLRKDKVQGAEEATSVHYNVGKEVRTAIKKIGGTMPEDLPTPEKSIQQIEQEQIARLKAKAKKRNIMLDE